MRVEQFFALFGCHPSLPKAVYETVGSNDADPMMRGLKEVPEGTIVIILVKFG